MSARKTAQHAEHNALSRSAPHRLRGRRGSLEAMPNLPLDVIILILRHLHLRDILSLAQSSKAFRELLVNRQHAFMRKTARSALPIALPDPHPVLSEPALVNLMFSSRWGHACDSFPIHKVVWIWFKRYCNKCMPQMGWTVYDVEARMDAIGLDCVQGSDSRALFNSTRSHKATFCLAAQVEDFEMRWHNVHDTLEVHEQLDARTALDEDRKACAQAEAKLATQLEEWSHDDHVHDHDAREERFADVLRRLEEAGWGPELEFWGTGIRADKARDLYTHRVAPNLTHKTWPKVLALLTGHLEGVRRGRIEDEGQQHILELINDTITKHYAAPTALVGDPHLITKNLIIKNAGPTTLDIAWMPESAFLFTADSSTSCENDAFWVSQLIVTWEERLKDWLRAQVRVLCGAVPGGIDPLDLAVAVFGCARCETPGPDEDAATAAPLALHYPEILAHGCFRRNDRWRASDPPPFPVTKAYQQLILDLEGGAEVPRCALVPERISSASARRSYDSLVQANRDPNVTQFEEVRTWAQGAGLLEPLSGMDDVLSLPESNSPDDTDLFGSQYIDGTMWGSDDYFL